MQGPCPGQGADRATNAADRAEASECRRPRAVARSEIEPVGARGFGPGDGGGGGTGLFRQLAGESGLGHEAEQVVFGSRRRPGERGTRGVGPGARLTESAERLGERRELGFGGIHGGWCVFGWEDHHPLRSALGVLGFAVKQKPPPVVTGGGGKLVASSEPSRCARNGHGNSYDHGYDVGGGGFGGNGGREGHERRKKSREGREVKAGVGFRPPPRRIQICLRWALAGLSRCGNGGGEEAQNVAFTSW